MEITKDIRNALREITRERGKLAELAEKSGVHQSYISKYISGKCKEMQLSTWRKLEPFIVPYFASLASDESMSNNLELLLKTPRSIKEINTLEQCVLSHPYLSVEKRIHFLGIAISIQEKDHHLELQDEILQKEEECRRLIEINLKNQEQIIKTIKRILERDGSPQIMIELLREILGITTDKQ